MVGTIITRGPAVSSSKSDAARMKEAQKRKRRKQRRSEIRRERAKATSEHGSNNDDPSQPVLAPAAEEVDYVPEELEIEDPNLSDFKSVLHKFYHVEKHQSDEEMQAEGEEEIKDEAPKKEEELDESVKDEDEDEDEDEEVLGGLSKRKMRLLNQLTVAELKQRVGKPEVVEWVDVTAADPELLVFLKSYRNTVPVPIHWSQKRKYLQGKRGIEKTPFELPQFIKDTGIMQVRQTVKDKDDASKLKQRQRERMNPKMGKLEIEYQRLHDAFFKYQTKPRLSRHGELYYEGKEFETRIHTRKPGAQLSEELKEALGMGVLHAPPWLVNMQRFGPPKSYPGLKIPGLNAPIPEGAQWGFQAGGYGKPPVDEFGRPIYGDVFGTFFTHEEEVAPDLISRVEMEPWGALDDYAREEEEEAEAEMLMEEEERPEGDDAGQGSVQPPDGLTGLHAEDGGEPISELSTTTTTTTTGAIGLDTSGLETPASVIAGLETPDTVQLRKQEKSLYKILPQKQVASSDGFLAPSHVYDVKHAVPAHMEDELEVGTTSRQEFDVSKGEEARDDGEESGSQPSSTTTKDTTKGLRSSRGVKRRRPDSLAKKYKLAKF